MFDSCRIICPLPAVSHSYLVRMSLNGPRTLIKLRPTQRMEDEALFDDYQTLILKDWRNAVPSM